MFFIVSTGRSGTTTLACTLDQSPNCTCLHEPKPRFVRKAPLYHYGELSEEKVAKALRATRQCSQTCVYGESSHKLTFILPILAEIFPRAKYIWLIRDGREVVASSLARGLYKPTEQVEAENPNHPEHLLDWHRYRLNGARDGSMQAERWDSMSRFEKNCWRWSRINQLIEQHTCHLNLPTRKVRLENMAGRLPRLSLWLNIAEPISGFKVGRHNATQENRPSWKDWTINERRIFERWCGEMMDKHYPDWRSQDGAWRNTSSRGSESLSCSERFQRFLIRASAYPVAGFRYTASFVSVE